MAYAAWNKNRTKHPNTPQPDQGQIQVLDPSQEIFLAALANTFLQQKKQPHKKANQEIKTYASWFPAPHTKGMNKLFSAENAWILQKVQQNYQSTAIQNTANKKLRVYTYEKGEKAKSRREDTAFVLSWAMKRLQQDKHVSKRLLQETIERAQAKRNHPSQVSVMGDVHTPKGMARKVSLQSFYDAYPHVVKGIENVFGVQIDGYNNTSTITLTKKPNKKPELRMQQALVVLRKLIERSYEKQELGLKDLLKTAYGITSNDENSAWVQKKLAALKETGLPEMPRKKPLEPRLMREHISKVEESEQEKHIKHRPFIRIYKKETPDHEELKQKFEEKRLKAIAQLPPQTAKRNKSVSQETPPPVFYKPQPALTINGLVIGDDKSRLLSYTEYAEQKLICVDYTMVAPKLHKNPHKVLNADFLRRTANYKQEPYEASKMYDNAHRELFTFNQLQELYFTKDDYKPSITVRYTKDLSKPDALPVVSVHHSVAKINEIIPFKLANYCLDPSRSDIIAEHIPAYKDVMPLQNFYTEHRIVPAACSQSFQNLQEHLSNDARAKVRGLMLQNGVEVMLSVEKKDFNKKEQYESYVSVLSSNEAFERSIPDEACRLPLQVDSGSGAFNAAIALYFLETGKMLVDPETCAQMAGIHAQQRQLRIKSEHMINGHKIKTKDRHGKETDDARTAFILNDINQRLNPPEMTAPEMEEYKIQ